MILALVLIVVFALGAALAAYGVFSSRRGGRTRSAAADPTDRAEGEEEFAELSDAARCDMVFAVTALDEKSSSRLLEQALADPAEAVALAAAHGLATSGRGESVRAYARDHPGERARLLVDTMGWMAGD